MECDLLPTVPRPSVGLSAPLWSCQLSGFESPTAHGIRCRSARPLTLPPFFTALPRYKPFPVASPLFCEPEDRACLVLYVLIVWLMDCRGGFTSLSYVALASAIAHRAFRNQHENEGLLCNNGQYERFVKNPGWLVC